MNTAQVGMVAALTFVACGGKKGTGSTTPGPDLLVRGSSVEERTERPHAQLLVISDTHASNPMAPHNLRTNNVDADKRVGAAMRPPQLELWGLSILDFILTHDMRPRVTVHLGDAGNIACSGEFARFADLMNFDIADDHAASWIMAPGNHDTLVMGNWAYKADEPPTDGSTANPWNQECAGISPAGSMDKAGFLDAYLTSQCAVPTHAHGNIPAKVGLRSGGRCVDADGKPITDRSAHQFIEHLPGKPDSPSDFQVAETDKYFRCADASLAGGIKARECRGDNTESPYAWFLLQTMDLDDHTQLLVLDTTQYDHVPAGHKGLLGPGGVKGGIFHVQLEQAATMVDPGKALVVAGHFPLESLDGDSRQRLLDFLKANKAVTYLSGHIHSPTNARIHPSGTSTFTELNFASVMGWPMEYSYFTAAPSARANAWSLDLDVYSVARELYDDCLARWAHSMERPGSPAFYTDYKVTRNGALTNAYPDVRKAMFEHMLANLKSSDSTLPDDVQKRRAHAAQVAEASKLVDTELSTGHRPKMVPGIEKDDAAELDGYERCQAVWASEAESAPGEKPAWWHSLPGVRAAIEHFDDPPPAHAFFLRSPAATHEAWHWDVSVAPGH